MRKLAFFLSAFLCGVAAFSGCSEIKTFVFIAPDGGTLLPVAKLFTDAPEIDGYRIAGEAVSGTSVESRLFAGTCDAAIAPINLCAKVYNTAGNYVLAGVAAWGNNYILSASGDAPETLADLYGEIVYAFGGAAVPGLTLKKVLTDYEVAFEEIDDPAKATDEDTVYLLFLADPAAVQTQLNKPDSAVKFAYLPEPAVTALTSGGARKIAFDMQTLWEEKNGANYPQAGLIIKKSLVASAPQAVEKILAETAASAAYCLANPAAVALLAKDTLQSAALPAVPMTQKYVEGNGQIIMVYGDVKDDAVRDSVAAYLSAIMGQTMAEGFFLR